MRKLALGNPTATPSGDFETWVQQSLRQVELASYIDAPSSAPTLHPIVNIVDDFGAVGDGVLVNVGGDTGVAYRAAAATGRDPELKLHLRMARNQGWTEDELVESLLHLGGYVGVPLIRESLLVAKETFAEMRAEK